jgi:hypothetical protein
MIIINRTRLSEHSYQFDTGKKMLEIEKMAFFTGIYFTKAGMYYIINGNIIGGVIWDYYI